MTILHLDERQSVQLTHLFQEAEERTRQIFDMVHPNAYYDRPIPLRHPFAFYEGHIPAFLWNTLFRNILNTPAFQPELDTLFARGIDPSTLDAAARHNPSAGWPSRPEIQAYQDEVMSHFYEYLNNFDAEKADHPLLKNGYIFYLLLEHELMHQETLMYIVHQLPHHQKIKPHNFEPALDRTPVVSTDMKCIPAGIAQLGTRLEDVEFAWDNEIPMLEVSVDEFSMDTHNVTNGDFIEFVNAGGYNQKEFWDDETWQWKTEHCIEHPYFWIKQDNGEWLLKDFFEDIALPMSWPVYVTQAEARAYAKYKGKALPTEAQWHRAAYGDTNFLYPWGNDEPTLAHGNFDFGEYSPVAIGSNPKGQSVYGIHDLIGNGWEWTSTPFAPFPGFEASAGYPQYSTDFFDNNHYVIKGACNFTDARFLRRSFRNWFYWHYPYMHATFRCVSN